MYGCVFGVCVCVCVTDAEHVSVSMGMLANHRFHSQSVDQVSVGQKQPKRPYRVDVVAVQNTEDVICKSREWSVCVCVCVRAVTEYVRACEIFKITCESMITTCDFHLSENEITGTYTSG